MNAAEALELAVVKAIRARSRQIVASYPYSAVTLVVQYDRKTGQPREVWVRSESNEPVTLNALCDKIA